MCRDRKKLSARRLSVEERGSTSGLEAGLGRRARRKLVRR